MGRLYQAYYRARKFLRTLTPPVRVTMTLLISTPFGAFAFLTEAPYYIPYFIGFFAGLVAEIYLGSFGSAQDLREIALGEYVPQEKFPTGVRPLLVGSGCFIGYCATDFIMWLLSPAAPIIGVRHGKF